MQSLTHRRHGGFNHLSTPRNIDSSDSTEFLVMKTDSQSTNCSPPEPSQLNDPESPINLDHLPAYLPPPPPPPSSRIRALKRRRSAAATLERDCEIFGAAEPVDLRTRSRDPHGLGLQRQSKMDEIMVPINVNVAALADPDNTLVESDESTRSLQISLSVIEQLIHEKWDAEFARCQAQRDLEILRVRYKAHIQACTPSPA